MVEIWDETMEYALNIAIARIREDEAIRGYTFPSAMLHSLIEARDACKQGGKGVCTKTYTKT